ncbi:MAG TPA: TonB-dependent receptor plug domain-containing protein, partial [Bacteroidota bacterium]|nr:TonB-dependent receptor plug domain-containing protein [Bacteroidota bacterium]
MSERLISSVVLLWLACQVKASPSCPQGDSPLTPGAAAVADSSDTLFTRRLFALDEVVVTSQRIPRPVLYTPSATSVIPRRLIEQSAGTSLGNVLAAGNGLFVKDYGGPSGIKTISQRGLGTEHTLVLINGMPVNSVQNGGVDLGMTDAAEIERIEIVRGGQSALHGPHAVAGIVNVITRAMPEDEHASAGLEWGSFGYRHLRLAAGCGAAPVAW